MAGALAKAPRPWTARVLVPRLVALTLLVAAVAVIAALGGYAHGRGSVDEDALQAKAYAAGQLAGAHAAKPAAATGASASRSISTDAPRHSRVVRGPSAEARAELRRAYAAGVRSTSLAQRAHGRALGAAAVLGNFSGGWTTGRWYLVRLAPGGTLTAGRPRLASRVGPLAAGEGYVACRGGQSVCRVARGQ
jgi:hypothetical protein